MLAHELGHYARRHARFTRAAYRGSAALFQAWLRIEEAMTVNNLIKLCAVPAIATAPRLVGRGVPVAGAARRWGIKPTR